MKITFLRFWINTFLLTGIVQVANAQYVLKEADNQFKLFNYTKAIELYEQAYKKKPSLYAAEQLTLCYQQTRNFKETESWAAIVVATPGSKRESILTYAKALQSNAKYSEAKVQFGRYSDINKDLSPDQQSIWLQSCDSAIVWMKTPVNVSLQNEQQLNTVGSDWGAVQQAESIVFASDGLVDSDNDLQTKTKKPFLKFDNAKKPDGKVYGWTGNHYFRLYNKNGADSSISTFPIQTGTKYHVGPATFTASGDEMYYTLTRIPSKPSYEKKVLATVNIEIYSSKKDVNGKWSAPQSFAYNNVNAYSVGDPFIAKDGKTLFFVSDMPGGKGGTDMFYCTRQDSGSWSNPMPLSELNTTGNERSPFVDSAGNFYFSSDGLIGMGSLDIYKCEPNAGGMGAPVNMRYPVNSPQDDFYYNFNGSSAGFLASNRGAGVGSDDIYSVRLLPSVVFTLTGTAYDKETKNPLLNAIVTLATEGKGEIKVQTEKDGRYRFNLEKSTDYRLTGEKTNYSNDGAAVSTMNLQASVELKQDLYLTPIVINKEIRLENIYYDFDKFNIRPDAMLELDKLVKIMQDNPTIWIELGSHTDSRGDDAYNQRLSKKRAEAAVNYIIAKGISKNRIEAKGYGETRLTNRCSNGVRCSEAEHQENRRTEFHIVKY